MGGVGNGKRERCHIMLPFCVKMLMQELLDRDAIEYTGVPMFFTLVFVKPNKVIKYQF